MAHAHDTSPASSSDREELQRHFASVFTDINAFVAEEDPGKQEELREQLAPLCCMKRLEYKVQIAWGGPEYGFKLSYDPQAQEWVDGRFYWADWFRYEEEPLSPSEVEKVVTAYAMDSLVD
jgi:hypothetical protein